MIIPTLGITLFLSVYPALYFFSSIFLSTKSLVEKLLFGGGNVSCDDKNQLKFSGKTNWLKISLQNAYFYCFG